MQVVAIYYWIYGKAVLFRGIYYGGPNPPLYKTFAPRFYKAFAPRFYNLLHDITICSTILQNICSTILQFSPRFCNLLHDFTICSTILQFCKIVEQMFCEIVEQMFCKIVEQMLYKVACLGHRNIPVHSWPTAALPVKYCPRQYYSGGNAVATGIRRQKLKKTQ